MSDDQPGLSIDGAASAARLIKAATADFETGRVPRAIREAKRALALDPNCAEAAYLLGLIADEILDRDQAIGFFRQAIAADAKFAKAYASLGHTLIRQANYAEAVTLLTRASVLDPKNSYAWHGLGNALQRQERIGEAVAAYRTAVKHSPDYVEAWCYLGDALLQARDPRAAIEACDTALSVDRLSSLALAIKSVASAALDDHREVRRLVDFDRLLDVVEWASPEGFVSLNDFHLALADEARSHPSFQYEPRADRRGVGGKRETYSADPDRRSRPSRCLPATTSPTTSRACRTIRHIHSRARGRHAGKSKLG